MKRNETGEWVHVEGKIATVGITKYASQEFGEIVFVELPKLGQVIKKGDETVVLESTKAAADSYAPLSGKIVAINENLKENPGIIIKDPHHEGWLYKIEVTDPEELELLQDYRD